MSTKLFTIHRELSDYSVNLESLDTGHREMVYRGIYIACRSKCQRLNKLKAKGIET